MLKHIQIDDVTFDYMIARSGILGRQILRLCRCISLAKERKTENAPNRRRLWMGQDRFPGVYIISRVLIIFFTYYIGGSLTRSDQITFAGLLRMNGKAYRLTLYNALFCGIPCAAGYFLLGEGFDLLRDVHSYAELPAMLARHTSLAMGATSLAVDLFRLADSAWHRRCWAPFGCLPLIINLPTYMKRLYQRSAAGSKKYANRLGTESSS